MRGDRVRHHHGDRERRDGAESSLDERPLLGLLEAGRTEAGADDDSTPLRWWPLRRRRQGIIGSPERHLVRPIEPPDLVTFQTLGGLEAARPARQDGVLVTQLAETNDLGIGAISTTNAAPQILER